MKRNISQFEYERRQFCLGDSALKIPEGSMEEVRGHRVREARSGMRVKQYLLQG